MCSCGEIEQEPIKTGLSRYQDFSDATEIDEEVILEDGRMGTINDVIRNGKNVVIGYVVETQKGKVRVFKDKVTFVNEMEGPPAGSGATLDTVTGQGSTQFPSREGTGSGDAFPSLNLGAPAGTGQSYAKKHARKKTTPQKTTKTKGIPSFNDFIKTAKKMQG
jgi:hypothetical protein